jgi:uncharacterized protein YndB with AHSA1/START domain
LKWGGQDGLYRCTKFNADLRVGGKWLSSGVGPDGNNFAVSGEFLEVDPPRLLVYSWVASWTGDAKTTVRWNLVPADRGTLVRIQHIGLAQYPQIAQSYRGWPRMLGWLQALLERGETVETRKVLRRAHRLLGRSEKCKSCRAKCRVGWLTPSNLRAGPRQPGGPGT